MAKLGYTNSPRLLVKRSLQKLDAETLKAEHVHICGASALGDMTHPLSRISCNTFSINWKQVATHSQFIGNEWDVRSPRGGVAGAHRPKSEKCR